MAVTTDILSSWRSPRSSVRRHLARGKSEAFLFSLLLVFLVIAFIGQWPVAAREAFIAKEPSAAPRILALAFGFLAAIPFLYGLAAISRLVAQAMGGRGTWYTARLALFWSLATVSPLMLLLGLTKGMVGEGPSYWLVTTCVAGAFLWLWLTMLHEVERG